MPTAWSSTGSLLSDRIPAHPTPSRHQQQQRKDKGRGKAPTPEPPKSKAVRTLETRLDGARRSNGLAKDPKGGCFCQARKHTLSSYIAICRQCGLILCTLNPPYHACPHCISALSSEDGRKRLVERLERELAEQLAREEAERQRAIDKARAAEGEFPMLPGSQAQMRTSRTPPPPATTRTVLSLNSDTKRVMVSSYSTPTPSRPVSRAEDREEDEGRVPGPPGEVSCVNQPPDPERPWKNVRLGDVRYVPTSEGGGKADGDLPDCTPFLMPFHISYNGPAPVSRYLRPRPAPPSLVSLSVQSSSTSTLVASSSSTSALSKVESSFATISTTTTIGNLAHGTDCGTNTLSSIVESPIDAVNLVGRETVRQLEADVDTAMDSETQPALDTVPLDGTRELTSAPRKGERFVAAFRGRQMYGQAVGIPSGYGGLVLRMPFDAPGKGKAEVTGSSKPLSKQVRPKSKVRAATRRFTKRVNVDDAGGDSEGGDEDCCLDSEDTPPETKKLIPCSKFASFMLWTPDRTLDEGKDEYLRTLVEWTRLAAEIHACDE